MEELEIQKIIKKQRNFFNTGVTLNPDTRINALKRLKKSIMENQNRIHEAIESDLGKSSFESYMCETGLALSELSYMIKHTRQFSKEKTVPTPIAQYLAKSYVKPSPYGTVLIMSPWNYPFLLTIDPLIDAIAAGNTVVLKPSAYSPATSAVIKDIISECFPDKYVAVITGGREENQCLFNQKFDYIFFTGSQAVGHEVLKHAAKYLTPVTLELGGKSPCIVDSSANIKLAARRIVFGKLLNCGQTCVAPDYLLCEESIKAELIEAIKKEMQRQYTKEPLYNKNYGKIINQKQFDRILSLIDKDKVILGGQYNNTTLKIEPTIIDNVSFSDDIMQQEIFGPLLPVITFKNINSVIEKVNSLPKPLALYYFSENKASIRKVMSKCQFGGGCVNDTIIHLATNQMGFGGVGESGMGSYHGKCGFKTFSHYKSIVDKKTIIDLPMRYQPYRKINAVLIKMFLH